MLRFARIKDSARATLAVSGLLLILASFAISSARAHQEPDHLAAKRESSPMDDLSTRPVKPPREEKNVKVLFGGKPADLAQNWIGRNGSAPAWPVSNGVMTSHGGDIMTKERYTDYRLHVEFKVPYMPDAKGQGRGNSGVYVQGRYEIQVLDSFGVPHPGTGECGAVYNQKAPLVNACRAPLKWQTYDIIYRAPRGDDSTGKMLEPGHLTVIQNGVVIHAGTTIDHVTGGALDNKIFSPGPVMLQDHGNAMQYRDIWIVPLPDKTPTYYESPEPRTP